MPYRSIGDLPASVRGHLPQRAQKIYRAAFNSAWDEYAERDDREAAAHRVAWSAVKKEYRNQGGRWVAR